MSWPGGPANVVIVIKVNPCTALLLVQKLKAIVVDEDVCSATLKFVSANGSLDGLYSWRNNGNETFLVDGALDSDVREIAALESLRKHSRVKLGVEAHLTDWSNALSNAADNDLSEELPKFSKRLRSPQRLKTKLTSVKNMLMGKRMSRAQRR